MKIISNEEAQNLLRSIWIYLKGQSGPIEDIYMTLPIGQTLDDYFDFSCDDAFSAGIEQGEKQMANRLLNKFFKESRSDEM